MARDGEVVDPVLAALEGLTRGIVGGMQKRRESDLAEREMAIREEQARSKSEYYSQRSGANELQEELRRSQIRASAARMEEAGIQTVQDAQKQIGDVQKRASEITSELTSLERRAQATQDPARQRQFQEKIAQLRTEQDTLSARQDLLSQQIKKKTGKGISDVPAKYAPWFNYIGGATSVDDLKAWMQSVDLDSVDPATQEKLVQAIKAKAFDLRAGPQANPDMFAE